MKSEINFKAVTLPGSGVTLQVTDVECFVDRTDNRKRKDYRASALLHLTLATDQAKDVDEANKDLGGWTVHGVRQAIKDVIRVNLGTYQGSFCLPGGLDDESRLQIEIEVKRVGYLRRVHATYTSDLPWRTLVTVHLSVVARKPRFIPKDVLEALLPAFGLEVAPGKIAREELLPVVFGAIRDGVVAGSHQAKEDRSHRTRLAQANSLVETYVDTVRDRADRRINFKARMAALIKEFEVQQSVEAGIFLEELGEDSGVEGEEFDPRAVTAAKAALLKALDYYANAGPVFTAYRVPDEMVH